MHITRSGTWAWKVRVTSQLQLTGISCWLLMRRLELLQQLRPHSQHGL